MPALSGWSEGPLWRQKRDMRSLFMNCQLTSTGMVNCTRRPPLSSA